MSRHHGSHGVISEIIEVVNMVSFRLVRKPSSDPSCFYAHSFIKISDALSWREWRRLSTCRAS